MMNLFSKISTYQNDDSVELPKRQTAGSAGYDFSASEDILIPSIISSSFKLLVEAYTSSDFLEKISATKAVNLIKNRKFDNEKLIQEALLEIYPYIMSQRVLTLDQIKDMTKITNTKLSLIPTGIKAYLDSDCYLEIALRSSIPMSSYLMLGNAVGIIDSDYVDNKSNEGHIFFQVINLSPFDIQIKKGDRIGQGIIKNYKKTDDDISIGKRVGGSGSTSK